MGVPNLFGGANVNFCLLRFFLSKDSAEGLEIIKSKYVFKDILIVIHFFCSTVWLRKVLHFSALLMPDSQGT